MTLNVRSSLSGVAVLFAGILGTFVLISPPQSGSMFTATARQLEAWNRTLPTGVAVACVLAVLTYAAIQRAASVRPAWITAVVTTAVLIAARLMVSGVSDLDQLTLLYYTKCVAGGVLLGAAVAAAWSRTLPRLLLAGAVVSTFVVAHTAHAAWSPSTSVLGEPFWWMLLPALALAAVCAVIDTEEPARTDGTVVREVIAAVVTLALAHRLLGEWIDGQSGSRFRLWVVAGLCLVLVVALTEFWARRLESQFLLAATAVAAVAPFATTALAWGHLRLTPWVPVTVGVATVAVGVTVGLWRPLPLAGLATLALIPLVTAIDPTPPNSQAWFLAELAVLGVGIGLALGATLPDSGAPAALGLVVPLLSLVFATVVGATTTFETTGYAPIVNAEWPHRDGDVVSILETDLLTSSITFDRGAAIALLLVVVFCAIAIRGLRARPVPRAD
ncbi:hypothetical protein [Rhodococcus spongiicola]|uniref:Uncharacterized protein n=1 Tax=Rhodococcus spongiicola TaxID=2487352 RepID=A0A438ASH5_9NOCA|nr:hypothetical protein [Rhodococcus spongiicola]RVW01640.1 hypothetical protein EF834_14620 [Rhodococcus spongiicola]